MKKLAPVLATLSLFGLLLVSIYFSLCSILAIPLLDDSNSLFSKENSLALRQQLDAYKKSYSSNFDAMQIDSVTLYYFDAINTRLKSTSRSANFVFHWSDLEKNIKQKMDLYEEEYLIQYDTTRTVGQSNRTNLAKGIQQAYIEYLSSEYTFLANALAKIRHDLALMYNLSVNHPDSSFNENLIKDYRTFYSVLYINDTSHAIPINSKNYHKSFGLFTLAAWPIENDSQFLALFMGILGFSFFGASLAGLARETISRQGIIEGTGFYTNLAFLLFKGFSASFLVYLSIKGGISILSSGGASTTNSINPYFILFVCFVAAFFSEAIWQAAQNKLNSLIPGGDSKQQPPPAQLPPPALPPAQPAVVPLREPVAQPPAASHEPEPLKE